MTIPRYFREFQRWFLQEFSIKRSRRLAFCMDHSRFCGKNPERERRFSQKRSPRFLFDFLFRYGFYNFEKK